MYYLEKDEKGTTDYYNPLGCSLEVCKLRFEKLAVLGGIFAEESSNLEFYVIFKFVVHDWECVKLPNKWNRRNQYYS